MKLVNVLVTGPLDGKSLQQIATTSPRVKLKDASSLVHAEREGHPYSREQLDALLSEAEVVYGLYLPINLTTRAPRLKWVQVMLTGMDDYPDTGILDSPVLVTNVAGIGATPVSELVLGLMLMFVKQAPLSFRLQQEKQWRPFITEVLRGKTVGVVGLGSIGLEVARLASAFGMKVIGTDTSAKQMNHARYIDIPLPQEQLLQLLSESDFVVLSLPLTKETEGLIGERELQAMKPTAYLINTARGKIVDEEALVHALEESWIAGAGLDVVATEPLPAESKLWELPNVSLSPHVAGRAKDRNAHCTEVFCQNLRRYLKGQKLIKVVDKKRGF